MREILPGILTWPWFSARHGYDFNGWLVRHSDGNLCIDPPEMGDDVLDALEREGVARVILTNRNHFRSSMRVRQQTGARIAIHPADAAFVRKNETEVDDELRPGERVGPLVVVDAHGKSPGEVALHWPERGILFVGDACVGKPPGECALLPDKVLDDKSALIASLRRLAGLDFDVLLVGDGAPILQNGRDALQRLVARLS